MKGPEMALERNDDVTLTAAVKVKAALSVAAAALAALTLLWRDWIEIVFGADPDHGDGSLEWMIVGVLIIAAAAFGLWATSDVRRLRTA
jgi:hypothetical protein